MHALPSQQARARQADGASAAPPAPPRWSRSSSGTRLVLFGDIDVECTERLAAARAVLDARREPVSVDASEVTFIDVAGLRAVLGLAVPGEPLRVLAPSPCFRRLVELLALLEAPAPGASARVRAARTLQVMGVEVDLAG